MGFLEEGFVLGVAAGDGLSAMVTVRRDGVRWDVGMAVLVWFGRVSRLLRLQTIGTESPNASELLSPALR